MISKLDPSRNYSYLAIAAIFGFVGFMMQPTAYTWAEQDMMPFFERIFDAKYLSNDFFTNTTMTKNPRWVYGYLVVAISWVTTLPWYKVLYILKLLLLICTPVLYFKILLALLRRYISEKALNRAAPFVLLCLVLMVILKEYRYYFSVASWLSYTPALHAYNISIFFGFLGILLKEGGRKMSWYLAFFFVSCLVHPAMGLFTIGFYLVLLMPDFKKELREILFILASGIIAVLAIKIIFAAQQTLPVQEFVDIYVKERHSWHYSVPDFGNLKGDWQIFFVGMCVFFLIPFLYGIQKKNKALWKLSLFALISYSGAIAFQYFFIEVLPLKVIAYMGISRFTTFGYWMLVVVWAIPLSDFMKSEKTVYFPSLGMKNFVVIIISLIFVGILFIDNPKETFYNNRKGYYDFIQNTSEDAIFVTYSRPMNTDMRLIGRRGVFVSDEFPFAEQYIAEYGERWKMIFGSRYQESHGIDFYRNLKPNDFLEISKKYQLDYILIENKFNYAFEKYIPIWKDKKNSIYSVQSFSL
ncbi:hypothetical protein [Maribacter aestuarii]|uniref:hypothetical protein n=1 Tax=Maribacter aestuarii TaxID=1130723 RepID=UPI00248BCF44|nr:hypothetical protein [Maribacter aestuarii]